MTKLYLGIIALLAAALVGALSIPVRAYDPLACQDEVADYQGHVQGCLEAATDLAEAKGCWEM